MPRLDQRVESLEQTYPPPRERMVIRIVPMMRPGRMFVPSTYSLPGGKVVTRGANESQLTFEARVSASALAATPGVAMVFSVEGDELPEA